METTLTGPILYLLVVWGVITVVFIGLLMWRSLLASHEDDQIFLGTAEEHMAREQRELVAKISSLSTPISPPISRTSCESDTTMIFISRMSYTRSTRKSSYFQISWPIL